MGNYNSNDFSKDLEEKLKGQPHTYDAFEKIFLETLEIHAPQKTKTVRANNKPYLNKDMRKAIMHRSRLQNKMYKCNSVENQQAYKRQRNYCNRLYKRTRGALCQPRS